MMNGGIRLGRVAGIPVSMNWSVLLIGGFLTWALATGLLPDAAPGAAPLTIWLVALVGAAMFFLSLLAHEFGHAIVARRAGVEVDEVTLWLFGGVARLRNDAATPGDAFRIAAAGPAVSLGLALSFGLSAVGLGLVGAPGVWTAALGWLALINGVLAVFNLLPGLPLDGGRILQAALWKRHGDRLSATVRAAAAGRVVGGLLIALGLIQLFSTGGGIWTAFIGFFLISSAKSEEMSARARQALEGVTVGSLMHLAPATVRGDVGLDHFASGWVMQSRQPAYPVIGDDGRVDGLITLDRLGAVPAGQRWRLRVRDVAWPAHGRTAPAMTGPGAFVVDVLSSQDGGGGGWILVFDERGLAGMVGPDDIRRAVQHRMLVGAGSGS